MIYVGRDLKAHLIQFHLHGLGHLPPDQFAPSSVQPGSEHLHSQLWINHIGCEITFWLDCSILTRSGNNNVPSAFVTLILPLRGQLPFQQLSSNKYTFSL